MRKLSTNGRRRRDSYREMKTISENSQRYHTRLMARAAIYILITVVLVITLILICERATAEDAWVICNPNSFVYIRAKASFGARAVAMPNAGDKVELTGWKIGDWVKVTYLCEEGEGWIFSGYLSDSEPELYPDGIEAMTDYKQVRARRYANGPVIRKLEKGTPMTVYAVSSDWSVTSIGYIKTEYLLFAR